jgi:ribonuclease HI
LEVTAEAVPLEAELNRPLSSRPSSSQSSSISLESLLHPPSRRAEVGEEAHVKPDSTSFPRSSPPPFHSLPPPEVDSPVGGRLALFWGRWADLGCHPFVVRVLREGFSLSFRERPRLSRSPTVQSASHDPVRQATLTTIVDDLLAKNAVEPVTDPSSPGFYSRLFFVPKKTGGNRPIIDLSQLNLLLDVPKFRMESVHSIRASLNQGSFGYSVDLRDAYFHILIHPRCRKYLRFTLGDRTYQFRALPFGLSSAPWIFTKVMREVKALSHSQGMILFQYLDDWLGEAPSEHRSSQEAQLLLQLCSHLGLVVNLEKSELIPKQDFVFLGVFFDLLHGLVRPTTEHGNGLLQLVNAFLNSRSQPAVRWQSLIGTIVAQERFIHLGRFYLRPIQWHLASHWSQRKDSPLQQVPVTPDIAQVLSWWTDPVHLWSGVPLHRPTPTVRLFTDASTQGWGAHCEGSTFQGLWSTQESTLHINVLEMRAVLLAIEQLEPAPGSVLLVATDNSTVVAYVNKQGGLRSSQLWHETRLLFSLLESRDLSLRARHIPGRLNVIADQLSRQGQILPTEWSLHPDIVRTVFQHWSPPLLDLFATRYNHQLPVFVSPVPDPAALDVDALSITWEGLDAYAFPPHVIMTSVLKKFQRTKSCRLILVAPNLDTFSWFPLLLDLKSDGPLHLPPTRSMLKQPQSDVFHRDPGSLHLHAWLLQKPR